MTRAQTSSKWIRGNKQLSTSFSYQTMALSVEFPYLGNNNSQANSSHSHAFAVVACKIIAQLTKFAHETDGPHLILSALDSVCMRSFVNKVLMKLTKKNFINWRTIDILFLAWTFCGKWLFHSMILPFKSHQLNTENDV